MLTVEDGLKCFNVPTCDVKIAAPETNTPAMVWVYKTANGFEIGKLIVLGLKIPFTDCG